MPWGDDQPGFGTPNAPPGVWDGTDYNRKVYKGSSGYQSTNPEISYDMDRGAFDRAHPDYWSGGRPEDPVAKANRLMERRLATGRMVPTAINKTRSERALAALYGADPRVRTWHAENEGLDVNDWRSAVQQWTQAQGIGDPSAYAVQQGFMPKPPARTIKELVDERTLNLLKQQWLTSPELENRINTQLEGVYQADLAGTEPPPAATPEGSRELLPIASMQYLGGTRPAEATALRDLVEALGMNWEDFMARARELAPPGGGAGGGAAQMMYRGR